MCKIRFACVGGFQEFAESAGFSEAQLETHGVRVCEEVGRGELPRESSVVHGLVAVRRRGA